MAENKVVELTNLNGYFKTPDYQERLLREKLNYSAPGEKVVIVPAEDQVDEGETLAEREGRSMANPEKWWRKFFVNERI